MLLPDGLMLLPHIHPIIRPPRWAHALTERNDAAVALCYEDSSEGLRAIESFGDWS